MGIMSEVKSPEEIKREIEGKGEQPTGIEDPRLLEDFTFEIDWADPRGKVWKGKFVNRILSGQQISQVGAMKARMAGGVPWDSLDEYTSDHNEKLSHLTFSLIERPSWAKNLGELKYKDLLDAIYQEVSLHEATFSGRVAAQAPSSTGSGDAIGPVENVVEQGEPAGG